MVSRIIYVLIAALAIVAGGWFMDTLVSEPGTITVDYGGRVYTFTLFMAALILVIGILALLVTLAVVRFVWALLRFIIGDETAFNSFFARSRERRGLDALSKGMVAVAAGDGKTAMKKAKLAEKNLRRPALTRLLNAQASELVGDEARALTYYKALAAEDNTAFIGTHGLIERAMLEENTDKALGLVNHALDLNPKDAKTLDLAYTLQSQKFDWASARKTLKLQRKAGHVPQIEADSREAALALAMSEDADGTGDEKTAQKLAMEAARLDPSNVNAVSTAVRHLIADGAKRAASKLVVESWRIAPHPQLAAAYAAIEPDESPAERRRRFEDLFSYHPNDTETHFLRAELSLVADDYRAARSAIEDLRETEPSARSCAIMAAIARGENEPEHVVRAWLARGIAAPRAESSTPEVLNAAMLPLLMSSSDDSASDAADDSSPAEEPAADTAAEASKAETASDAGTAETTPEDADAAKGEAERKPETTA